jgi:hypothetical protein
VATNWGRLPGLGKAAVHVITLIAAAKLASGHLDR